jgi:hypothetical protein
MGRRRGEGGAGCFYTSGNIMAALRSYTIDGWRQINDFSRLLIQTLKCNCSTNGGGERGGGGFAGYELDKGGFVGYYITAGN